MTQYSGKVIRKNPVTPTQQAASGVWKLTDQAAAIRNNNWPVPGVPNPISRSVRFRASASAYFSRTPSIAGNRQKFTWSGWVKRGLMSSRVALISAGTGNQGSLPGGAVYIQSSGQLELIGAGGTSYNLTSTALFRDPSAWYHIVIAFDTTQAASSNRIRVYINSAEITAWSSASYPSQNFSTDYNNTVIQALGSRTDDAFASCWDGYMTEVNWIDGQQLTPSSFGTTDPLTGVWEPIAYTGTYGTNGFYLNFKDNTSTTTLGYDYSGNSNNWTANNISLTSGATYDSMLDVPTMWVGYSTTTDTSAVTRGNYCVMNPLDSRNITNTFTLNANLGVTNPSTGTNDMMRATFMIPSGKWYWETTLTSGTSYWGACIIKENSALAYTSLNSGDAYAYSNNGTKNNGQTSTSYGNTYTAGDVVMVAFDSASGKIWFGKNGTWQASGDPVAGTNEAFSGISGNYFPGVLINTATVNFNFGQRPFSYTPPSGFKTLTTTNLPDSTIVQGSKWMDVSLWTGNGSARSITNSGSMQPDLVWVKSRSISGYYHVLTDAVRGTNSQLFSNDTLAQETRTDRVTSFNADGFSLGVKNDVNDNGATFVGWQWKEGATGGFDIVTYTGTGANRTVAHNLGVAPAMIILKNRTGTQSWFVYHSQIGATKGLFLEQTTQAVTDSTYWNNTAPTSSVFTVGTGNTNVNSGSYVAYLFAPVSGFSAMGSYTGNGSTDGPFVFCGFRPRFLLIKSTTDVESWIILDSARSPSNVAFNNLLPNSSLDENVVTAARASTDILSNGFKLRNAGDSNPSITNKSGSTYIYAAFAENPFKNALAR